MNKTCVLVVGLATGLVWTACAGELNVAPGALSPQAALARIRAAKAAGDASAWTVRVAPGVYPLAAPLVFTPADSGTPGAPVTWVGAGASSVIAGGTPVTDWREDAPGVWSAPVPKAPDGAPAYFEQLWVNDRRAARARLPNAGYFRIVRPAKEKDPADATRWIERFALTNAAADVLGTLDATDLAHAQLCLVHKWAFARRILRGFDPATRTVTTHTPGTGGDWTRWSERETLVAFENVRGAFDAPGEWFYDAKAARILYRPLPGEDVRTARIVAPNAKLGALVVFAGEPDAGRFVHDIVFRDLAFAYSDAPQGDPCVRYVGARYTPAAGGRGPTESWQFQAAIMSDAALRFTGAHRTRLDCCRVAHTGGYALRYGDGCVSNAVTDTTLEDLGAGGVWMGAEKGYVAQGEQLARRVIRTYAPRANGFNLISNCTIRAGGRFNPEGTGVAIGHAADSKVLHCDISDFYYTGVSVGWTWGFRGSVAQRNEIGFNRIWDLGKGVMSDMGGVYTLGTSYGTRVHDNIVHDVNSFSYGGWALYTDEGSEGIVMERNLCWNTTDGGFHQHYGAGCIIRNNIFAWNRTLGAVRMARPEVQGIPCTLNFVNNIVLVREGPLAGAGVRNVGGVWANNLWWDVSGKPVLDTLDWAGWTASGKETGSRCADPRFADADAFDFRLKPDSPAFALGFKPWDYAVSGRK